MKWVWALTLAATGCCGTLLGVDESGFGVRLEEQPGQLRYTLHTFEVFDPGDGVFSSADVEFTEPPLLGANPPQFTLASINGGEFAPDREVPPEAEHAARTVDVGHVAAGPRETRATRTVDVPMDYGSVPVRFEVTRTAYTVDMIRMHYDEVVVFREDREPRWWWTDQRWVRAVNEVQRLQTRDQTASVRYAAVVQDADYAASGYDCPVRFGEALLERSTPVFEALYRELRGLD